MNKEAILHIPLSQYAYATDERSITVRIRTAKNDLTACYLYYGNRVAEVEPIPVTKLVMEKCASDDLYDYYEAGISSDYNRVCYYFGLICGNEEQFLCSRGFSDVMEANRTEYFQYPYIRREELLNKPEWTKNAVMYHIFPDSFANGSHRIDVTERCVKLYERPDAADTDTAATLGNNAGGGSNASETAPKKPAGRDRRGTSCSLLGGTLKGITQSIGHLKALGITLVYLNPIFAANAYHKYDTADYFEIDPCFGTKADFKELVDTLHENGIRIVLDGVFNHCGPDFFAFKDVLENGENSKYRDWFYKLNFPIEYKYPPNYECFAYVKNMPKLNTGNPEVREYICNVGKYWISEFDIDGWRLDVANEVDHDTWRAFRKAVLSVKPDAFLIAEIWEDADVWLKGDQFDSAMNYMFTYLCRDFFALGRIGAKEFDEQMNKTLMRYPAPVANVQMNMLDSHDVPRFLHYCGGNTDRLKLAFFYMMTAPGIPSVFYGDELFMTGEKESEYRAPFPWDKENTGFEKELAGWIAFRKAHPALTEGSYRAIFTDDCGLYIFARKCSEEELYVVINNSPEGRTLRYGGICGSKAETLYAYGGQPGADTITVGAYGGAVLKRA